MRAVIYRRVSTGRQASRGASLDQQREACDAYAAGQGWRVVADYVEAGRSAYAEDLRRRPQFQRLLADARGRAFDVVLVYELSRFARRQRVQYSAAGDLEHCGVRVVSVTEPMDLDTIGGFVTYSVLAMQAELHSRLLSQRMKAVRAREADLGTLAQKPARGQVWADGRLIWDDAEAALPRRAYALAATGQSARDVLDVLLGEGYHISLSSLHYLLRNPAYIGMLRHKGRVLPASWPPLVDRATWDAVQAFRASRNPAGAVRATVRSREVTLLAGLAFCVNCGAKLHYEHHEGRRCYYRCSCRDNRGHCNARPSRADKLDAEAGALVAGLAFPDAVLARARAILEAEHQAQPAAPALPATADRLRRLARAYADGAFTDAEYERRRAAILDAPEPAPAPAAPRFDLDTAMAALGDIPALWEAATVAERRALLGQLVSQVYARHHRIYAVRPTRMAEPLLRALWESRAVSHSWSSPERSPVLLKAA